MLGLTDVHGGDQVLPQLYLGVAVVLGRGDGDHALDVSSQLRHCGVAGGWAGVGGSADSAPGDYSLQPLPFRPARVFGLAVLEGALLADGARLVLLGLDGLNLGKLPRSEEMSSRDERQGITGKPRRRRRQSGRTFCVLIGPARGCFCLCSLGAGSLFSETASSSGGTPSLSVLPADDGAPN